MFLNYHLRFVVFVIMYQFSEILFHFLHILTLFVKLKPKLLQFFKVSISEIIAFLQFFFLLIDYFVLIIYLSFQLDREFKFTLNCAVVPVNTCHCTIVSLNSWLWITSEHRKNMRLYNLRYNLRIQVFHNIFIWLLFESLNFSCWIGICGFSWNSSLSTISVKQHTTSFSSSH